MKTYIKIIFLLCIICWTTNNAFAIHTDTIIRVDQEYKSISAPDAVMYQWYVGGEKIIGATDKNLKIEETGTYKVELINMHGDTTKIESSFLVTAAGAIIKIYIIGDSTVCNYNASAYPQAGWGQILPAFFNTANLSFDNHAIGGRSSRSFFEEGRWTPIKNALLPGDYVFIQWGHNDRDFSNASRYTPVADYKTYLTMYCNDVKAKGAIPVLVSPMVLNAWTGTTMRNVFTENGNNYRGAMLEVATALNIAFVDLNMKSWNLYKTYGSVYNQHFIYKGFDAGEYPNYPAGINDGTHFQEMGAICNARMIVQGIGELSARADMANLINNIKPQYSIAVNVNPVGRDSMTTKSYTYPVGLTVTLKTIPKKSSTFQKWNNAANTQISTARLTSVISGSAATSYTAIYTGATTCISSISTSTTTTFCSGGSAVLTASTGASYKWFNGTTQVGTASTYAATAAGNYTVEVTNTAGCKATSAVKTITVNPLPVITQYVQVNTGAWTAAATASVCEGNTVNLGPQPNLAQGWAWTGPNNFTSTLRNPVLTNVVLANAGNYVASYTDPNGCKASSTFALQVSKPTATITSTATTFCAGGSVVLTASSGSSYKWFNGTNQVGTAATYTATATGAYTVEVTNAAGCKATSAVTQITGSMQLTPTITSPSASFCTGGSVVLTASTGSSYKWFNGTSQVGTASTYTATAAGAYTVEVTNAAGCKATSAVTQITGAAQQTPTITTGGTTTFCTGGSVVLTASAGSSYKWFNGTTQVGTASTYTATAAGAYTVEVTNASGCKATSAVTQITGSMQLTPTITTGGATTFCTGGSVVLTASSGSSYKWFNGTTQVGTASIYTATAAGAYTVEVTNAAGCKATSAVTQINGSAQQTPTITTEGGATTFCAGGSVVLTASAGTSYKWFNGTTQVSTASTYTATAAGAYTVEVTNAAGCKATSAVTQINGSAQQTPTITTEGGATTFCAGGSVVLTASAGTSYKWFNGTTQVSTASTYTATAAGAYTVEVTNAAGCKATSAVTQITVTSTVTWYADADNDGIGDISNTLNACTKPNAYVSTSGDACPADANKAAAGNCGCGNTEASCLDCNGTPNGIAFLDNCSICVGGTTGNTACVTTGTIHTAYSKDVLSTYPQPFSNSLTISLKNKIIKSVTFFNSQGLSIEYRQGINASEIQMGESLSSGIYFIVIESETEVYTSKVIKY